MFDESPSRYLPPTPDLNSNPSSNDEVSEAEMPSDEPEIETREESLISFRLSGPNGRLSRFNQSDEETDYVEREREEECVRFRHR